jgi:membrane dipeptidase
MRRLPPVGFLGLALGMVVAIVGLGGSPRQAADAASGVAAGAVGTTPAAVAPEDVAERVRRVMRAAPLVDGHNDLPWAMREAARYSLDRFDVATAQPRFHTDIPRLRRGLLGAQFWSVYVPASLQADGAVTATLEQIAFVHELSRRYPDTFTLASTAADVERIAAAGRIGSLIGMEGGHSIGASLPALRAMYQLGARYMTLTHSANVPWADSGTDTARHAGLTPFGEAVVREMNWLGMLVDLSHVSPETMEDALRVTAAPVIFSHSAARALCDVPRNVPDAVLQQLPRNGGVVMVTFVPGFLSPEVARAWDAQEAEEARLRTRHGEDRAAVEAGVKAWLAAHPRPRATLAQVADHIDHVRKVAGIDHIGVGSDFDGIDEGPAGLEDVSRFPALVEELFRRGYADADVSKILGGNLLRVMREAERVAARLQAQRGPSSATIEQLDGARDEHHRR